VPGFLVDASVWVAVTFPRHPHHGVAQDELARATVSAPAVFCRATQQSFLRLVSTPQIFRAYQPEEVTNYTALAAFEMLCARPDIVSLDESPGTVALWHRFAARDTASPKVWMDAYLAAFAISGGLELVTLERDFKTYEAHGLRLRLLLPPTTS
jgi:toxin-antitoxin system PIN domain toxin